MVDLNGKIIEECIKFCENLHLMDVDVEEAFFVSFMVINVFVDSLWEIKKV